MTMTRRLIAVLTTLALLVAASTANATVFILFGDITPPGDASFTRVVDAPGEFTDSLGVRLTDPADFWGRIFADDDAGSALVTDILSVEFFRLDTTTTLLGTFTSPEQGFSLAGLAAGDYGMLVHAIATELGSKFDGNSGLAADPVAKYRIEFSFTEPVATSVPEPGSVALVGVGVLALALVMSRRRRAAR
jgi:hypothetical protein